MAEAPGHLTLERNRDLVERGREAWIRRAAVALFLAIPLAALFNLFGQEPSTASTPAPAAKLTLTAPARVRGGLIYQGRIQVDAHREIAQPKIALGGGWFESLTINTISPQPVQEATQNGLVVLSFDRLGAGQHLIVWIEVQSNPVNLGSQSQNVYLYDGSTRLATLKRSLFVWP